MKALALTILILVSSASYASQSVFPDEVNTGLILSIKPKGSIIACIKTPPTQENNINGQTPMLCKEFYKIELMHCVGMPWGELICSDKVGI